MIRRIINKIESIYRYRYFYKVDNGAYQFLLKKVYKSTDIDFLEQVWQLDFFREILKPKQLEIEKYKKVLVLAPHQDDEIIGCGGTLIQLKKIGASIDICFLTNGSEISNPTQSIAKRNKEAALVCKALNATKHDLGIDNVSLTISQEKINKLTRLLQDEWDLIFTIWPLDNPPKHRLCSYLFGKALEQSQYKGQVALYAVHTNLLPNFHSDISLEINRKHELLSLYSSQLKHQNYTHLSKALDAWNSRLLDVSSQERFIEVFMKIPAIAYKDFQNIYNKANTRTLFKSNDPCIKSFKSLKAL